MYYRGKKFFILGMVAVLVALLGSGAWADDTVYLQRDSSLCDTYKAFRVSGEGCGEYSSEGGGNPSGENMLGAPRSIRLRESTSVAPVSQPVSVSVPVLFKFDSYIVSPEFEAQLDKIAKVIKSRGLIGKTIHLVGHADASGGSQYNLQLSIKRAAAVRQYLVDRHGLDINRFPIEGKGEADLYDPLNPLARSNRRVEFVVN